jgi:hypothetical protein
MESLVVDMSSFRLAPAVSRIPGPTGAAWVVRCRDTNDAIVIDGFRASEAARGAVAALEVQVVAELGTDRMPPRDHGEARYVSLLDTLGVELGSYDRRLLGGPDGAGIRVGAAVFSRDEATVTRPVVVRFGHLLAYGYRSPLADGVVWRVGNHVFTAVNRFDPFQDYAVHECASTPRARRPG